MLIPEDLLTLEEILVVGETRLDFGRCGTKEIGHQPGNHLRIIFFMSFVDKEIKPRK